MRSYKIILVLKAGICLCLVGLSACRREKVEVSNWESVSDMLYSCKGRQWSNRRWVPPGDNSWVDVRFSSVWGGPSIYSREGIWSVYCSNQSREVPKIKGFSSVFRGIVVEGRFDMSSVRIGKSVERFFWDTRGPSVMEFDFMKYMPDFSNALGLEVLNVYLSDICEGPNGEVLCRDKRPVPTLNLSQYVGLTNLKVADINVHGLVSNLAEFVRDHGDCFTQICAEYERYRYYGMSAHELDVDKGCELVVKYGDSDYGKLMNLDLTGVDSVDITIDLSVIRQFDLSRLMRGSVRRIDVWSRNCVIVGMENAGDRKELDRLHVFLKINRHDSSGFVYDELEDVEDVPCRQAKERVELWKDPGPNYSRRHIYESW